MANSALRSPSAATNAREGARHTLSATTDAREVAPQAPSAATGARRTRGMARYGASAQPGALEGSVARSGRRLWNLLGVACLLAVLATGLALAVTISFDLRGVILPGVQVGGVPVQGLTAEQAAGELERIWNQELRVTAVDVSDPARAWLVAPAEFGLRVEPEQSAILAYAAGRGRGLLEQFRAIWVGSSLPQNVKPVVQFDPLAALAAYQRWAPQLAVGATDAGLRLETGDVIVAPSAEGRELDLLASLEWLAADPAGAMLDQGLIPLVTRPVQPGIPQVDSQVAQVEALLTSEPTLTAYDPVTDEWFRWAPDRGRIASWIEVQAQPEAVSIGLDQGLMREFVASSAQDLGPERFIDIDLALQTLQAGLDGSDSQPLIVHYGPRQHIVRAGETVNSISFTVGIPSWRWLELNPQVKARGLSVGEALVMPPRDAMLDLPVIPGKRIVISLAEQHMWVYQDGELIADHVVSTGIPRSPTMAGIFQVKSHYLDAYASNWDLYMPHFLGIYDAVPGFENGIHGLPLLSSGVRLWGNVLGRPASYGCIILTLEAAEELYAWAEDGVVVEIVPQAGD